jgi:hypothetical protein
VIQALPSDEVEKMPALLDELRDVGDFVNEAGRGSSRLWLIEELKTEVRLTIIHTHPG